ncbi:ABC1 kinase family protein [Carboxydothermus hydrogenoformans]|uniref:ABC1 family protein n=1 Tax=Carboxydothermus hydrogenoformans (strain ATCC BAA-161 / DSM 6008 / Z-2901) TaxID=246194 RepID=Q3ACQ9_CARHZ|nr:AarF/UbiB family protein [Carboxydothermus hydrogenoformans]ABB13768.1 ABC1 family protein [Carboxydothermus hydrogenoformans Z-2901]
MQESQRLGEILRVLSKYGLTVLKNKLQKQVVLTDSQILQLFTDLGPTFIKFGQFLSTRPDLVDERFITVLRNLQDNVPAVSFTVCKKFIEETFAVNYFTNFKEIDPRPIASASIAQVYFGILKSGEKVVLKIKRPDIEETIKTDLEVIKKYLLPQLRALGFISHFDLNKIFNLFEIKLKEELDFLNELQNLKIFHRALKNYEDLIIPKAFKELSGRNVLVMEYVDGNLLKNFLEQKVYYPTLGEKLIHNFCRLLFWERIFHADPHPGNIIFTKNKKLCFLDLGAVGFVDQRTVEILAELFIYLCEKNLNGVINLIFRLGQYRGEIDEFTFYQEMYKLLELVSEVGKGEVLAGKLILDIIKISIKYGINLPVNLVYIGKAALTLESTAISLGTRFNFFEIAKKYGEETLIKTTLNTLAPSDIALNLYRYLEIKGKLPLLFFSILKKFDEGTFQVIFRHAGLEIFIKALDRTSMRITFGLIISSLLIASGLIVAADGRLLQTLGTATYILSILAAGYLIYLIFKSGKWH